MLVLLLPLLLQLHTTTAATDHVEYFPGCPTSNLIISCPHDGFLKPKDIPDRQNGCYDESTDTCDFHHDCGKSSTKCRATTVRSVYAARVGKAIQARLAELTGCAPHLIVMNLNRVKVDPNRDIAEAAQHDPIAEAAYLQFHSYIQTAHDTVAANNGNGLHLDLQGHSHSDKWLELGYGISRTKLNQLDSEGLDNYKDRTTIKALAHRSDVYFPLLLAGPKSLGGMLQRKGFRAVPSPHYPRPSSGREGEYFSGGYITRRWGSRDGGDIDAVQLMMPYHARKHSPTRGRLAEIVLEFLNQYY